MIELHPEWDCVDAHGNRDLHITCRLSGYDQALRNVIPGLSKNAVAGSDPVVMRYFRLHDHLVGSRVDLWFAVLTAGDRTRVRFTAFDSAPRSARQQSPVLVACDRASR